MNPKNIVKLTNIIGSIAIFTLLYWIFTFIAIEVFDFKIFRKNLSETFYLSIIGILSLMFGSLIINIMLNLTRIAEKDNKTKIIYQKQQKWKSWVFLLSFPVLLALLWSGDYLTKQGKKEKLLKNAASIIKYNMPSNADFTNYSFDSIWINQTEKALYILSATDESFPSIYVMVRDTINEVPVYLQFGARNHYSEDIYPKKNYINPTSESERIYLNAALDQIITEPKFEARDGRYELYYPYSKNGKTIVFYFSEYDRYGKVESY